MLIRATNQQLKPILVNSDHVLWIETKPPSTQESGDGGSVIVLDIVGMSPQGPAPMTIAVMNTPEDLAAKLEPRPA